MMVQHQVAQTVACCAVFRRSHRQAAEADGDLDGDQPWGQSATDWRWCVGPARGWRWTDGVGGSSLGMTQCGSSRRGTGAVRWGP